jgi:hypothetical protein
MSRANLALLISGVCLGVALATFLWRIVFDVFLDAPRVRVTLKAVAIGGGAQGGLVDGNRSGGWCQATVELSQFPPQHRRKLLQFRGWHDYPEAHCHLTS